jgi:hypothetical protein
VGTALGDSLEFIATGSQAAPALKALADLLTKEPPEARRRQSVGHCSRSRRGSPKAAGHYRRQDHRGVCHLRHLPDEKPGRFPRKAVRPVCGRCGYPLPDPFGAQPGIRCSLNGLPGIVALLPTIMGLLLVGLFVWLARGKEERSSARCQGSKRNRACRRTDRSSRGARVCSCGRRPSRDPNRHRRRTRRFSAGIASVVTDRIAIRRPVWTGNLQTRKPGRNRNPWSL